MSGTSALDNGFAREVRAGLTRPGQKTLPCSYFYDAVGSALFEAITALPEYGLTRADARVIEAHAEEIAAAMGSGIAGSGTGQRIRFQNAPVAGSNAPSHVLPHRRFRGGAGDLRAVPGRCGGGGADEADYLDGLRAAAARREPGGRILLLFLGSTIGNFEPEAANEFLYRIRGELAPGDALLLGTDLVKPAAQLLAAYDDPAGVTAAFNRNLLARINRELGGNFDLRCFEHEARYDAAAQRIEMHLLSLTGQCVQVRDAGLTVRIEAGETIHTESCHKFRPEQVGGMARAGGFCLESQWIDGEWGFAENLLRAA